MNPVKAGGIFARCIHFRRHFHVMKSFIFTVRPFSSRGVHPRKGGGYIKETGSEAFEAGKIPGKIRQC
jgi:hypothetical protein